MEKSKDPGSKAKGGELGWFDAKRMVPEFGAAVTKLEKGKFTEEPVKTQFGYHVILLEDSRPIEAPPLEEVKPQLSQQLQQQDLKKQFDSLKAKAKIEVAGARLPHRCTVCAGGIGSEVNLGPGLPGDRGHSGDLVPCKRLRPTRSPIDDEQP